MVLITCFVKEMKTCAIFKLSSSLSMKNKLKIRVTALSKMREELLRELSALLNNFRGAVHSSRTNFKNQGLTMLQVKVYLYFGKMPALRKIDR